MYKKNRNEKRKENWKLASVKMKLSSRPLSSLSICMSWEKWKSKWKANCKPYQDASCVVSGWDWERERDRDRERSEKMDKLDEGANMQINLWLSPKLALLNLIEGEVPKKKLKNIEINWERKGNRVTLKK